MWFEYFKCLGIPSTQSHYDTMLCDFVTNTVVQKIASDFSNPSNQFDLNSPIEKSEVVSVYPGLTNGTAGGICQTTCEYIKFGGPSLWSVLYKLYCQMFESSAVPIESLVGMVLPLFKGKGLKASEKDNYRGITLSLIVLKVFETKDKNYFSDLSSVLKTELGVSRPRF